MELFALVLAGIVIATLAMAVGIGGGILWTPLLILVYGLSPLEAVATSLMIQTAGLASGSLAYVRAGFTNIKLSLLFSLVALPGVIIGGLLSFRLSADSVQMLLGVMAMTLAVLFVASQVEYSDQGMEKIDSKELHRLLPIPVFFGFLMGSLSVGISEWLIPALRHRLRLSMARSIGTVIPMMFILATAAFLVHWFQSGGMHWDYLLWGGLGTLIGGQIGPRIARRIDERILKQSFIYLMTLIGIHLIFQSI